MESDVRNAYDDGWSSHLVSAARRTCAQAGACWRLGERLAGIQVGLEAALACAAAGDVNNIFLKSVEKWRIQSYKVSFFWRPKALSGVDRCIH